ncbi:hypothetical protein COCOBI_07-0420 [Coccomyxa sp. Obi]|nr:hypothetical protein COCOBI_07-0420 [Coccomyxa sp. Obi]
MIDITKANITAEYRRDGAGFEDQVWLDFITVGTNKSPLSYNDDGLLVFSSGIEEHVVTVTCEDNLVQPLSADDFAGAVTHVKDAAASAALSILSEFTM